MPLGIAPSAPIGPIAGPNTALMGIAALASAVPAFFQGREMAMQYSDEQRQRALQLVPFLENAARSGDSSALAALKQLWTQQLGLPPLGGNTPPGATPVVGAAQPSAGGATAPQTASQTPFRGFGVGQVVRSMPQPPSLLGPGPEQQNVVQTLKPPTAPPAQPAPPPQRAQAPPVPQEDPYLTALGGPPLSDAEVTAYEKMPNIQDRITDYTARHGVPPDAYTEHLLKTIPSIVDPTAAVTLAKAIGDQIQRVEGGDVSPAGFANTIASFAPAIQQVYGDQSQPLLASLVQPYVTQMTQKAKLGIQESAARLGLTQQQVKKLQLEMPYVVPNLVSQIVERGAQTNLAKVRTWEIPQQLSLDNQRLSLEASRLKLEVQRYSDQLNSATHPGSYAFIRKQMDSDSTRLRGLLDTTRKDLTVARGGGTSVLGEIMGSYNGSIDKWLQANPNDPLAGTVQNYLALQNHLSDLDATLNYYDEHRPQIQQALLHNDGAPPYVRITKVNGQSVQELTTAAHEEGSFTPSQVNLGGTWYKTGTIIPIDGKRYRVVPGGVIPAGSR